MFKTILPFALLGAAVASSANACPQFTELVSMNSAGVPANYGAWNPAISGDGRYIVFSSQSTNLVPGHGAGGCLYDRATRQLSYVGVSALSISDNGTHIFANNGSICNLATGHACNFFVSSDGSSPQCFLGEPLHFGGMSANGRFVAFSSDCEGLIPTDPLSLSLRAYLHDCDTGKTIRISPFYGWRDAVFYFAARVSDISGNGRFISFVSNLTCIQSYPLCGNDSYIYDAHAGTTTLFDTGDVSPQLSFDGRFVAFISASSDLVSGDTNGVADIFVRDRYTGVTTRANLSSTGAEANDGTGGFVFASNGDAVAFVSSASNLVPFDGNGRPDIFVRDFRTGYTSRVNEGVTLSNHLGQPIEEACQVLMGAPVISADGHHVAFTVYGSGQPPCPGSPWQVFVRTTVHHAVKLGGSRVPLSAVRISVAPEGTSNWMNPSGTSLGPLVGERDPTETRTDAKGLYSFPSHIPPGRYRVRAELPYTDPGTGESLTIYGYPDGQAESAWMIGKWPYKVPDVVIPDPVLLQSGLWDDSTGLNDYFDFLVADPAKNNVKMAQGVPAFLCARAPSSNEQAGGYLNEARRADDHTYNAGALGTLASKLADGLVAAGHVASQHAADVGVSLVGHSMGGIIARGFAANPGPRRIERLVTLDAPHGGTSWAVLSKYVPGFLLELFGLNQVPALTFRSLNGIAEGPDQAPLSWGWNHQHDLLASRIPMLAYTCNNSCDSFVTPDVTAFGYGEPVSTDSNWPNGYAQWFMNGARVSVDDSHSDLTAAFSFCDDNIKHDPNVILETALFLVDARLPSSTEAPVAPATAAVGVPELSGRLTAPPRNSGSETVLFEGGATMTGMVTVSGKGASESASYGLTHKGRSLQLRNVKRTTLGRDGYADHFEIESPPAGTVEITLNAGAGNTALGYAFKMNAPYEAAVAVTPARVPIGSAVRVTGFLRDRDTGEAVGQSAALSMHVRNPQGEEHDVDLFDDGRHGDGDAKDGVFGTQYADTSLRGQYGVELRAIASVGALTVERTAWQQFDVVAPSAPSFVQGVRESTVDLDKDGLIDRIDFTVPFTFSYEGWYGLYGNLRDADGQQFAVPSADLRIDRAPATASLTLSVAAVELVRHQKPGPWTLASIRLVSLDGDSLTSATLPDHTTASYSLNQLERPPATRITGVYPSGGQGGTTVEISGPSVDYATEVRVGDRVVPFRLGGADTIFVKMPARDYAPASPARKPNGVPPARSNYVSISVSTPWGDDIKTDAFEYEE